ncbi:MAG: helix-turn-helix domain-containing protein [Acidobacteriota bacterium]|jgi:sugar-specific transcriptional regulator TrmB
MDAAERARDALRSLGLNRLEADVYLFLLRGEPATAYAVGKAIGKATANVYKAVESLAGSGAVLLEEGEPRVCRAVPPNEFLSRTRRDLQLKTQAAEAVLSGLHTQHFDERVYRIEDPGEVFERCERMLDTASDLAVIDAFPRALERISGAAVRAARRGLDVRVEAYRDVELPGCDVVLATTGEESVRQWGAEQLNVVVDGREVLLALLSSTLDRVHQALWSESLYLSCVVLSGRLSEHTLHRIRRNVDDDPEDSPARRALDRHEFFVDRDVPGQLELFERFATPPEEVDP